MPENPMLARVCFLGRCALAFLAAGFFCGCYSHQEFSWPEISISGPGWTAYNGQTVWKPSARVPELTGDLFMTMNTNGQSFMQFSKTLPFLTAQIDNWHWEVNIPSQKKTYSGRIPPPSHFAWLELPALLKHQDPTSPWQFSGDIANWKISNPATGETLSGFLNIP